MEYLYYIYTQRLKNNTLRLINILWFKIYGTGELQAGQERILQPGRGHCITRALVGGCQNAVGWDVPRMQQSNRAPTGYPQIRAEAIQIECGGRLNDETDENYEAENESPKEVEMLDSWTVLASQAVKVLHTVAAAGATYQNRHPSTDVCPKCLEAMTFANNCSK